MKKNEVRLKNLQKKAPLQIFPFSIIQKERQSFRMISLPQNFSAGVLQKNGIYIKFIVVYLIAGSIIYTRQTKIKKKKFEIKKINI